MRSAGYQYVTLDLEGRPCLLAGGGPLAVERLTGLLRSRADNSPYWPGTVVFVDDEGKLLGECYVPAYIRRYPFMLARLRPATADAPPITIRHLLSHGAGFPEDNPWGDQQLAITDEQMSALMRRGIPFSNAPGVAYEYSNYGFAILGRIVTRVSGVPYRQYLSEHVLRPLGMTSTTLEPASDLIFRRGIDAPTILIPEMTIASG